jgi:hypothetical protein
MRKKDIEKLIISQRENVVPLNFENIKNKITPRREITQNKRKVRIFRPLIAAAAVILLIGGALFANGYYSAGMSTIYIDINPSLALTVNRSYNVLSVNDESGLTENENITGMNIEDAALKIIELAINKDYIKSGNVQNAISFSVNEKDTKGAIIVKNIKSKAEKFLNARNIICEIMQEKFDDSVGKEAQNENISPGKMIIIKRIIELGGDYTFDELRDKTVRELNDILKQIREDTETGGNGRGRNG